MSEHSARPWALRMPTGAELDDEGIDIVAADGRVLAVVWDLDLDGKPLATAVKDAELFADAAAMADLLGKFVDHEFRVSCGDEWYENFVEEARRLAKKHETSL